MIFFAVVLGILGMVYGYVGLRTIIPAGFAHPWNLILWLFLAVLLILPFLPLLLRFYNIESGWLDYSGWVGYVGLGFLFLVFVMVLLRDVGWLVVMAGGKTYDVIASLFSSRPTEPSITDPARRTLILNLLNLGIISISASLVSYGLINARRRPRVVEIPIPITDLPDDLAKLRIVQITDIHVGPTIKRGFVQAIVEQVNGLEADIIVFTGDLADGSVAHLQDDVAPLAELKARQAKFFVTGNHEYYSGVESWLQEVSRLGFTALLNEHRIIEHGQAKILIAGVPDHSGYQFSKDHTIDINKALEGASQADVRLLLAHQPRTIHKASRAGFDIQLSGHTHGGQFIPWKYLVALEQPYVAGLHKHDQTWIYVSNGTGYWGPPLRIGAPPEIALIRLIRA